jgi:prepilin-type processing-associated H-X9-DG protein
MKSSNKFTLIEMMVILAIIAILISLLIPGLSRARQASRTAVCASNERQMGVGLHMWSQDNKNYIPAGYAAQGFSGAGALSGGAETLYMAGRTSGQYNDPWNGEAGTQVGGKWDSVLGHFNNESSNYVNREIRLCPTVGNDTLIEQNGDQSNHFSFGLMSSFKRLKTTHLSQASNFLYLTDGDINPGQINHAYAKLSSLENWNVLRDGDPDTKDGVSFIPLNDKSVNFRHPDDKSNVLFGDGHVKALKRTDFTRSMFRD